MSERQIIDKLFESRRLPEAEFQSGGSTYRSAFGNYWRDDQKIERDDYFKAKELATGSTSSNTSTNSEKKLPVSDYAAKAGSKMREDQYGPYFYDNGDKGRFSDVVSTMSQEFMSTYSGAAEYQVSKSQYCYYDEETGMAMVVKTSDRPNKSWVQVKKLSDAEVSKLKTKDAEDTPKHVVSEDDYESAKDRVRGPDGKMLYRKAADDDLVILSNKGDNRAQEEILTRYEKLVYHLTKDLFIPGGEKEDLVQEGLIGIVSAMKDYVPGKNKDFKQFAILAAKRNMLDAIKSANTYSNSPLNQSDDYETSLSTKTTDKGNPETAYMQKSDKERLTDYMKDNLTDHEQKVLALYLKGYDYNEIAEKLGKSYKSAENAMRNVRYKLKQYKELYKESALVESILESIESNNLDSMKESYNILFA